VGISPPAVIIKEGPVSIASILYLATTAISRLHFDKFEELDYVSSSRAISCPWATIQHSGVGGLELDDGAEGEVAEGGGLDGWREQGEGCERQEDHASCVNSTLWFFYEVRYCHISDYETKLYNLGIKS
jgi:hypothetical protein